MKEVWKDIKGYECLYKVSNQGRIFSIHANKIRKLGKDKSGYLKVELYNKSCKTYKIHRLVANTFIPNPENKPEVNHINGIITDNCVDNLEWCTTSENASHRIYTLHKNSLQPCKRIICKELGLIFPSITMAAKFVNLTQPTLSEVIDKENRAAGGYHWITQ